MKEEIETKRVEDHGSSLLKKLEEEKSVKEKKDSSIEFRSFTNGEEIQLHTYYCATCGKTVLITKKPAESLKRRKTDDSLILDMKKVLVKHYLKKDKLIVIKREINKYEKQYSFTCNECGVMIAFQCYDFQEENSTDEAKKRREQIFMGTKKKVLYILTDGLVKEPKESLLFIEMQNIAEGKNKKDSHIRLKKYDIDTNGKVIKRILYV